MKKVRENVPSMVFGFYTSVRGKGQFKFNRVVHSFYFIGGDLELGTRIIE